MNSGRFWDNPYAWLWYHLETPFVRSGRARRPFTFIIRDFYHEHPVLTSFLLVLTGYGLGRWFLEPLHIVIFALGLLMGHLFWGAKWIEGEQEEPPYCPKKK